MDQVVTGEAVLLDLRPATFASRAVSGAIDLAAALALLLVASVVSWRLSLSLDGAAAAALTLVVLVSVAIGVPALVETLTRGRTLGKLAMGLRAVRDDGGPIRLRQALVRALVGFVEVWLLWGVPALLTSLLSQRGKRLGDLAAGTYVVRERASARATLMPQLSPALRPWARTADIARLPDGLALSIRQFLGRAPGMHPQARAELGGRLAAAVGPYLAPAPPEGTPPELLLEAVLAERRRRDVERLAREQHLRRRLAEVDAVDAALAQVRRP